MTTKPVLYDSIETLPIKRWYDIIKTGELKHLFISGKGPVTEETYDLWLDIQQQYYDEFGITAEFRERIMKMQELVDLQCDFIATM